MFYEQNFDHDKIHKCTFKFFLMSRFSGHYFGLIASTLRIGLLTRVCGVLEL